MHSASRPSHPLLLAAGLLLLATFAGFYAAFHCRSHDADSLRLATEGLLRGETHWITFQNRVLAPALIDGLRAMTGWSWFRSFHLLAAACMLTGAGALARQAWRHTGSPASALGAALAWFALALCFNHAWSYPWDFVGAALNTGLVLWAFERFRSLSDLATWRPALLLAALALNRESSLIALSALLGTVLIVGWSSRSWRTPARALLALGAAVVANIALISCLRAALFVRTTRPPGVGPASELATGNFLQLGDNLALFTTPAAGLLTRLEALALAGAVAIVVAAYLVRLRAEQRASGAWHPGRLAVGLHLALSCGALFVFADLSEYRVYFELIPFLLVAGWHAFSPPGAGPTRASSSSSIPS